MQFIFVYNQEPHPTDHWWLGQTKLMKYFHKKYNSRVAIDIPQPMSYKERVDVATRMRKELFDNQVPICIDDMYNRVRNLYTTQPMVFSLEIISKIILIKV
ncbi:hypothetical protein CBLAS_1782 [Campylobacter blaseri]|uniref:Uncharacterized protein n=1 Tax=Campylobacter blaseri TaxID=2042961 RepID=A0A2P8R3Q7_9BACT|nr:hypothetical protein CQ405_00865 [Campylobacter blaseri]PSM54600.1 hypothetical protein CRN67_00865 [Campylobacter blaseri]QKF86927.1 hypothetical protein CBLAS_1782 [Campylobacter blaseri]